LSDVNVAQQTGLTQIVYQPTRGTNVLDRIFESSPMYNVVRVVTSVLKSDHRAVVAYASQNNCATKKTTQRVTFRAKTPDQHASFLKHLRSLDMNSPQSLGDTQGEFDHFYNTAFQLLNQFYPERTITVTSRDPGYITPAIKASLRRKNRLMRAGRVEEASALAGRIGKKISNKCKLQLSKVDGKVDSKSMWAAVRQFTGRRREANKAENVTATSLNEHYACISTDTDYHTPPLKLTAATQKHFEYISEWQVFKILDTLRPTSTGLDHLPSWFLRLGAPVFCKPLARLFTLSVATSTVPSQWKTTYIRPIPKVPAPSGHADFRPISVTPVLTRVMEKIVVRQFLYPSFITPPLTLTFSDQFAFRPTGSTVAALIYILHTVTQLLTTHQYVIVVALDFSKAFDSVRHATLLSKMADLDIPDNVYNWLVSYFSGHSHCTKYDGLTSTFREISAGIIQGSGIGPSSYVVNSSDLKAITPGNSLCKYADDTYLIIPSVNEDSRTAELENVEQWSRTNNLVLNRSKSLEIIFSDKRRKHSFQQPPPISTIKRVTTIKILGVFISSNMSVTEHINNIITSSAQTIHALRILRSHGMQTESIHTIYRAVVIAKLTYASSAWWGFTTATDRQRLEAVIRRGIRSGLSSSNQLSLAELVEDADDDLFSQVLYNNSHVLNSLLPMANTRTYNLRQRSHNRTLVAKTSSLTERDFILRMLYKRIY